MILKTLENLNFSNFPVVIFGSGPAGVSVALQLEKYKIRTLLIEAGEEQYSDLSQKFYEINNLGDKLEQLEFSRLRQFGGTSGHWGGWSKPLDSYHLKDWLIKYGDLSKYQEQTSKILEIKNDYKKH
jgi:choline dehydrogenase-like flavoprotein